MAVRKKRPGEGRPTKYCPTYCEALVKHMKLGLSYECFAGKIGVCRDTLYEWEKVHPKFSDSKRRGYATSLLWHEKQMNDQITGKSKGSTSSLIFAMKNKFEDLYSDKKEIKHEGVAINISPDENDT
jgi:hypothetical protein